MHIVYNEVTIGKVMKPHNDQKKYLMECPCGGVGYVRVVDNGSHYIWVAAYESEHSPTVCRRCGTPTAVIEL